MADIKISELEAADQANASDLLEASQAQAVGYLTKHITLDQVTDLVVASDQLAEEIDTAIGEIPVPPPPAWTDITGKPDFNALYVNTTGDTMTGALAGTTATFAGSSATPVVAQRGTAGNVSVQVTNTLGSWFSGTDTAGNYVINTNSNLASAPKVVMATTGAVTLAGALTGTSATMSGNISSGQAGAGTNGSVRLLPGDPTHPGLIGFYSAANVRQGYIGNSQPNITYSADIGYHDFYSLNARYTFNTNALTIYSTGSKRTVLNHDNTAGNLWTMDAGSPLVLGAENGARVTISAASTAINNPLTGTTAAFSGEVTAATPTYPDNDTSVATTAYVTTAIAAAPAVVAPLNRLHNAALLICDKGTGPFSTGFPGYAYGFNRWAVAATGAQATFTRVQAAKGLGVQFTGVASNTACLWAQGLEAGDCQDLISQPMCLSVVASSSHLTTMSWRVSYCNTVNDHVNRTQIATGAFAMTTTPTLRTATFNAGANAANGLVIEFFTAALVAARTWTLSQPQLVTGSTPITFWVRSTAEETNVCRRYYQASGNNWTGVYMSAGNPGGMATRDTFPFSPPLFRSPDMAYTGQGPSTVFFADFIAWSGEWNTTAPNPDGRYLFGYTAEAEPVL